MVGGVEGYEHPLRAWMLANHIQMRDIQRGAEVEHRTVHRILRGHSCSLASALNIVAWADTITFRGTVWAGQRLTLADLLPRPPLQKLHYPEHMHWYEW